MRLGKNKRRITPMFMWGAALCTVLIFFVQGSAAFAHSNERAFILILPTQYYIIGGALVVALSFVVIGLIPATGFHFMERNRLWLWRWPGWPAKGLSILAGAFLLCLIVAGYIGDRAPLYNPLPQVLWSLWWVGFTFLHAMFGNIWAYINPWLGLYSVLTALPGLRARREKPLLQYPERLGYAPAIVLFFAFAWFELIYPAPLDPINLAHASIVYMGVTLIGMLLFGEDMWLRYGDSFSVFFRMVSWLSPFTSASTGDGFGKEKRPGLWVLLPGTKLLKTGALPVGGEAFIFLALASVSFDGLSRTFWWMGLIGANPLEHPGRTVLMGVNTLGFLATFVAIVMVFGSAVLLGRALAKPTGSFHDALTGAAVSIVPIAFGYHLAHYLPSFLVQSQDAVRALSDPFSLGWDLIGTRDLHVSAALLNNYYSVRVIWNIQAAAIVIAHVVAISVAHAHALRGAKNRRDILFGQIPMTVMMIGYTLFGLWLLAAPAAG